jgi:hypothetical protein
VRTVSRRPLAGRRFLIGTLTFMLLGSAGAVAPDPVAAVSRTASADAASTVYTGSIDGADYRIELPSAWNGTLLLYSHEYRLPAAANPATVTPPSGQDGVDERLRPMLLSAGYALAGSAYRATGWAVQEGLRDQVALLARVREIIGAPRRTIAWGASMGGLTSVLLAERNPSLVDGVLSLCGTLAGKSTDFAGDLDFGYALKTLLAPDSGLLLAHVPDGRSNQLAAIDVIAAASQGTPVAQARLVLATALADIPPQLDAHSGTPITDLDLAVPQLAELAFGKAFWAFGRGRVDLEQRAGGNPVGNVTADYRRVLARSSQRALVEAAYARAGVDLDADLGRLNAGPRVPADPAAAAYLARYGTPVGYQPVPTLTAHTTLDTVTPVEEERFFGDEAALLGRSGLLRQTYVARAGHCTFSPAEVVVAVDALVARVRSGRWPDTGPAELNARAAAYPASDRLVFSPWPDPGSLASLPPGYLPYRPAELPRLLPA